MKTLILYATKYGAAAEIAQRIAAKMDNAHIHNLKQEGTPALADFDCVIVGSSVYAGMFRKEAKAFLAQHADVLQQKKLGLYASGMSADDEQGAFANNVPKEVLTSAKVALLLGGIFDPKKAGGLERLIMKAVSKQAGYLDTIDDEKITQFALNMGSNN